MAEKEQEWTEVIEAKHSIFKIDLAEVWRYRDLVLMFVKRDFISTFKQTVLGPIWFFINPILTTLMYLIVFGKIAKLSTDGVPPILFYLAGVTLWNYFSTCLSSVSNVFKGSAHIMGKVYFPRLVMPLSIVVSNLMRFGVQLGLFLLAFFYYWYRGNIEPNIWVLAVPFLIVFLAVLSLGLGMIFSSLTTKYRDVSLLLGFGISLFMYATPVVYPVSALPAFIREYAMYNPLTGIFECFKFAFFGKGDFHPTMLISSIVITTVTLVVGTVVFNKVEKSFMDTV